MYWFTRMSILFTLTSVICGVCTNCDKCANNTCSDPNIDWCFCAHGCKPGYHGGRCSDECPVQCYTCGRYYTKIRHPTYEVCYECTDGYHNGSSTNCLCPINCQQCTSTTQCTLCNQGWYGTMCQLSCPTNCKDQICSKSDGVCTNGCIGKSFEGDYCNNCRNGSYGDNCDLSCPSNCKDDICTKTNGHCQHGCKSDNIDGMKCEFGKTGYYGEQCNLKCPLNCKPNICDQRTGDCSQGCNGYSVGKRCDVCIDGFYGNDCTTKCPSSNCFKSRCNISTGVCESCMDGYYGSFCDVKCYRSCLDDTCDQLTGDCSNGSHGNSEAIQDDANDTSTNKSLIAGWIFGGFSLTLM